MANLFVILDLYRLAFPGVLLVFYVVCWLAVGRDPKIRNVAPRYEPPAGISPGVARYILTGGSDGTTLAAVLAGLAAKSVIAIQPQSLLRKIRHLGITPCAVADVEHFNTLLFLKNAVYHTINMRLVAIE
jgi:hypothetical protein